MTSAAAVVEPQHTVEDLAILESTKVEARLKHGVPPFLSAFTTAFWDPLKRP